VRTRAGLTALAAAAALVLAPVPVASAGTAGGESSDGTIGAIVTSGHGGSGGGGGAGSCTYDEAAGEVDAVTRLRDGVWYILYFRTCGDDLLPIWVPQLDGEALAELAIDEVRRRLPAPQPRLAPPAGRLVTQLSTWIWTEPSTWQPVSATAWLPDISATVTARPLRLGFDPGDGHLGGGAISCDGPGRAWRPADGDEATSACSYTYRHASSLGRGGAWTTTMAIDWAVTFTATDGSGGALASLRTSTTQPVTVREIQALVTGRG
jgi:hypothetical protein